MKRSLLGALRGKGAASVGSIGFWLQSDGVAMARIVREAGTPRLTSCEFRALPLGGEPGFVLRSLMSSLGANPGRCHHVLAPHDYQTLLVDTPDVPPSEMREAVRWKIHDMVDLPLSDVTIDVFDVPEQISHGEERPRSLCVVVARTSLIEQRAATLTRSGCQLAAIDITEMALRNLCSLDDADRDGQVILFLDQDYSLIVITKLATVYLTRRIAIGLQALRKAQYDADGTSRMAEVAETLSDELFRSMEYCESRFRGLAPAAIVLMPGAAQIGGLRESLAASSALPVRILDMDALINGAPTLPLDRQDACMLALGAALRQEQTTL